MSRTVLMPYKMGSRSGKALAEALQIRRVYPNRRYRYWGGDTIINLGCGFYAQGTDSTSNYINDPSKVNVAGNKLLAYRAMQESVRIPEFTTDRAIAAEWQAQDHTVVSRSILRGHSGSGITICGPGDDLTNDPLYTKYIKKRTEYRVHVVRGQIIDYAAKMLRQGSEGNNFQVRSYDNGWIFGREGVVLPQDVQTQALGAVEALGLDFGAVDVGYNQTAEQATVYEVNTAMGMEGTTLAKYSEALGELCGL